jgi:hypothetical protein
MRERERERDKRESERRRETVLYNSYDENIEYLVRNDH